MNDLMIHVERAVRPVKATRRRKLEMREELLAHLQGIYDDERVRSSDDQAACQAACERFGPPEELSRSLTAAVPWYDPLLPWLNPTRYRPPMSFWAVTVLWFSAYLTLLVPMLGLLSMAFAGVGTLDLAAVVLVTAAIIPPVLLTLCAMAGTLHGVLRHRKAPRRAILYGVGLAGYLLPGCLILIAATEGLRVATATWAITASIATPVIVALAARQFGNEIRKDEQALARLDPWEEIELPHG